VEEKWPQVKNTWNLKKKKKDTERSAGTLYGTGEKWRNNSKKNEENEPK